MAQTLTNALSYQLLYFLAIACGAAVMLAEGRRRQLGRLSWAVVVLAWTVGGIVGAELPHMMLGDLVAARTAVGAVAGATLALILASVFMGVQPGRALDTTATAIPLAGAIARLGCFVAECCQGVATNLPIGIVGEDGVRRHPTQLYEAAFDVAVAGWIARSTRRFTEGQRFLLSLGAMSVGRFAIEFVRDSDKLGPLSLAQWIVGPVGVVCLALVARDVRFPRLRPRPVLATGVTALALQMPPISADTLYPRNYVSGGASWFGSSFDWVHDVGSCEVEERHTRTHKISGMTGEVGYRRQLSATSGMGVRLRPFSATENASESRDPLFQGSPPSSPYTPRLPYKITHRGATIAADFDATYVGVTVGGTFGQFYPLLDRDAQYDDPDRATSRWASMGLRLGTERAAVEIRVGDEYPMNVPLPTFTVGLGIGNGKDTRIRFGASDLGPFVALRHVRPQGLEINPMFGTAHNGFLGGVMVKQWFRTDPKPR